MEEVMIPLQLCNEEFRFLKIIPRLKRPTKDMGEWQKKNFQFNDGALLEHLSKGGNYGIIGGFGNLILIDADSQEISSIAEQLPRTFTIKTGSPELFKKHYFYIVDKKIKPIRLSKESVGDLGDVRSVGQYVVAPNSVHPSGNTYKVIRDIPITKITEEEIRIAFKNYVDKSDSTEFKTFPIDTKLRISKYVRYCNLPDYLMNNKLKENTSKNWKLFPYVIDILNCRQVTQKAFENLAKSQGHEISAVKGWVMKAKEGKLMKGSCKKMRDYLERFHLEKVDSICGECPLYKKVKEEKERVDKAIKLGKEIKVFVDKNNLAEQFLKIQPLYYDKSRIWWMWDKEIFSWEMIDEVDILNAIKLHSEADTINSKERNEIIESLKQTSRKNKPKEIESCWIQFKDKIYDIETDDELNASPEFFVANPIPWKLGETEETPTIDNLFSEWVGEKHSEELYELLAFSLVPDYFIHRIICLIGGGANGKSTFLNLLKKFVGKENITSLSLDSLMSNRFSGAKLLKKLVCLMGETNFNTMKRTDYLKKLCGGDEIDAEIKNKDPFDFVNYAKLIMATNSLPMTMDKTEGFYRRWKIIEFKNKFNKEKDILSTIPEIEYNNLALKCLNISKGLWNERIFTNDGNFEQRKHNYEAKSNPLMLFINNNYIKNHNEEILFGDFFESLTNFLEENNYRTLTNISVSKQLKAEGFEIKQKTSGGKTGKFVIGLGINNPNNLNNLYSN